SKLPKQCKFYNPDFCEPCKSPNNFNECDLVKIGNQIIVDKFIEQLPEPKTPEPDCKNCVIKEAGCEETVVCMFFKPKKKPFNIEELKEKAEKIREMYPNFNEYILKFMEAGEEVMYNEKFTKKDGYEIMKNVVEMLNPEKADLPKEEFIKELGEKALKFMNNCFDYILKDEEK
ncbi:unnamed protein product, partial [marine sediment metagenome]